MEEKRSRWLVIGPIVGFILLYVVFTQATGFLQQGMVTLKEEQLAAESGTEVIARGSFTGQKPVPAEDAPIDTGAAVTDAPSRRFHHVTETSMSRPPTRSRRQNPLPTPEAVTDTSPVEASSGVTDNGRRRGHRHDHSDRIHYRHRNRHRHEPGRRFLRVTETSRRRGHRHDYSNRIPDRHGNHYRHARRRRCHRCDRYRSTSAATDTITATESMTDTEAITDTSAVDASTAVTATVDVAATDTITATESLTDTETITNTENVPTD